MFSVNTMSQNFVDLFTSDALIMWILVIIVIIMQDVRACEVYLMARNFTLFMIFVPNFQSYFFS